MPGRVLYLLICTAVIFTMKGCGPTPVAQMSSKDLQTCDDRAAKIITALDDHFVSEIVPHISLRPGIAEITSPVNGSVLPFGPMVIAFKQPPVDSGVDYRRNLQVRVGQIYSIDLPYVGDPYAVVLTYPTELEIPWTPPGSGKYILVVLYRNLETTGEDITNLVMEGQLEDEMIAHGPYSLAYVCVQIDPPKAAGAQSLQPVTMMPLGNIPLPPTITRTVTPWPTITRTPTFTPTETATSTFTRVPPTRKPPTPVPPTPVPPTPVPPTEVVVNCSAFGDETSCNASRMCTWVIAPTGGGSCVNR